MSPGNKTVHIAASTGGVGRHVVRYLGRQGGAPRLYLDSGQAARTQLRRLGRQLTGLEISTQE